MDQNKNYADELDDRMWKTKGSRFNKYRRYKIKHKTSLFTISIITLYVFVINLIGYCPDVVFSGIKSHLIPFLSMILSILILILSLLEASRNYQIKSERLHNCAIEITNLYGDLKILKDSEKVDHGVLSDINKKYKYILEKYPENHDPIDYELFKASHYKILI